MKKKNVVSYKISTFMIFEASVPSIHELRCQKRIQQRLIFIFLVKMNLVPTLVTQPMLQHRPNRTELRSMDSYIQILCRFPKYKRKVPPPSPHQMLILLFKNYLKISNFEKRT